MCSPGRTVAHSLTVSARQPDGGVRVRPRRPSRARCTRDALRLERSPRAPVALGPALHALSRSGGFHWAQAGTSSGSMGRVYRRLQAWRERREPRALYPSALVALVPEGHFVMESAWPIPRGAHASRGVVVESAVFAHALGRLRAFRYEVRRWKDGIIRDAGWAVASPQRVVADKAARARARGRRASLRVGCSRPPGSTCAGSRLTRVVARPGGRWASR